MALPRHPVMATPPPTRHGITPNGVVPSSTRTQFLPAGPTREQIPPRYGRHGMTDEWGSISPAERFVASLLTNIQASVWLTGEAVMPREAGYLALTHPAIGTLPATQSWHSPTTPSWHRASRSDRAVPSSLQVQLLPDVPTR